MINITDKKNCCGCTACYSICPRNAITMKADEEGFKYPEVDSSLCTNCGLCGKACAFSKDFPEKLGVEGNPDTLACFSKNNETHKNSRSGGVFYELAKAILNQGGTVYGVAIDEAFEVKTVAVNTETDLKSLQKSKYVQSDKGETFSAVADSLKAGKKVFFSGTGCEIAGLRMFIKSKNLSEDNLITCDIVCHGVPSPLLWKDNVEYLTNKFGQEIKSVDFRDKSFGWKAHIESYVLADGKKKYSNTFSTLFHTHNALRPSCNNCHFCNTKRSGDITIADAWGFGAVHPEVTVGGGISYAMLNTVKGKEIFESVKDTLEVYDMPLQSPEVQPNLYKPSSVSPARNEFWAAYKESGYAVAAKKFCPFMSRIKLQYNVLKRSIKG